MKTVNTTYAHNRRSYSVWANRNAGGGVTYLWAVPSHGPEDVEEMLERARVWDPRKTFFRTVVASSPNDAVGIAWEDVRA